MAKPPEEDLSTLDSAGKDTQKEGTPIGVPEGYSAPTRKQSSFIPSPGQRNAELQNPYFQDKDRTVYGTEIQSQKYVDGDQLNPLNHPESIPDLQQSLVAAGLLDPKKVRIGTWDVASQNAYKTVLAFANSSGMTDQDALGYLIDHPTQGDLQGDTPAVKQLTSKADAEAKFRAASVALTGGGLPKAQEQQFANWYQQKEKEYYQQAENGGLVESVPTSDVAAEDYIVQHNKGQVGAYGMASRMQEFFNMLDSPVKGGMYG